MDHHMLTETLRYVKNKCCSLGKTYMEQKFGKSDSVHIHMQYMGIIYILHTYYAVC